MSVKESRGRVLAVDDEELVLRGYERILSRVGYEVTTAPSGIEAAELVENNEYDVIVSDIRMPKMDGMEFLRTVREHDLDVPVVLITGNPTIESAIQAVEYGAFRYLLKPFEAQELRKAILQAVSMRRLARIKREATEYLHTGDIGINDQAGFEARFTRAINTSFMVYQPIVSCPSRSILGYEALLRSSEPSLPHPGAILEVAEQLDRMHFVGQRVRQMVAKDAEHVPEGDLFVNLHPRDLTDDDLYSSDADFTGIADRVILEVTERAGLGLVRDIRRRVLTLREMGFRIALDDLGAGYAGLSTLTQLEPDIVKIDMSLVRDVNTEPVKQKLIGSMVPLFSEMDVGVIVEGVETDAERDMLLDLGCDLMQGFLFAKPERPAPKVVW